MTIVIQINGKHRGEVSATPETSQDALVRLASANPRIAPHIGGKPIKRTIYVKGRLLNLLV
jgi:leucyl-tRNA synthetase